MNGDQNRATWSKIRGLIRSSFLFFFKRPTHKCIWVQLGQGRLSQSQLTRSRSMLTELKDLQGILGLSKGSAGLVLLLGQIFDAIFNIFIGAESDKISLIRGYGRRKGWHLIGSVFCVFSLVIFFTPPPMFVHNGTPGWVVLLYLVSCQLM